MSQRAFEAAIGRLVCDGSFRREFRKTPEEAIARLGLDLTPVELSSLCRIGSEAIEAFVRHVDDRVQRVEDPIPRRRRKSAAG